MQLPTPVYKPAFNITRSSHLVSRVRDLEASRAFYCDLLGLVVSDEDANTLYLRGLEEACHHSLVLKKGAEPAVERVGLRVLTEEDLDLLEAHFRAAGFPTVWVEIAHQGRTLHTTDPAGTPLEFCATMETRPRLYAQADAYRGACALRLDHFQIVTPKVRESLDFYNGMGFRLSEYVMAKGNLEMVFLQRKGKPHDIGPRALPLSPRSGRAPGGAIPEPLSHHRYRGRAGRVGSAGL
jgi:catechol 2,3-dioxygenase